MSPLPIPQGHGPRVDLDADQARLARLVRLGVDVDPVTGQDAVAAHNRTAEVRANLDGRRMNWGEDDEHGVPADDERYVTAWSRRLGTGERWVLERTWPLRYARDVMFLSLDQPVERHRRLVRLFEHGTDPNDPPRRRAVPISLEEAAMPAATDPTAATPDERPPQPEVHGEWDRNAAGEALCSGGCGLPTARADRTGRGVRKGDLLKFATGHRNGATCAAARAEHLGRLVAQVRALRAERLTLSEIRDRLDRTGRAPRQLADDAVRTVRDEEDVTAQSADVEEAAAANGGKVGKPRGARAGARAKLTDDQVRELRELRDADPKTWTYRKLGDRFGVDDQTAYNIAKRKSRADVPDRPTAAATA